MSMEVTLGCSTATVAILDSGFAPIVEFADVAIIGNTGLCDNNSFGGGFSANPGRDIRPDF
jgi:hypothetical protein